MFEAIWRHLPGPRWLRVIEVLLLLFAIVAFLFEIGFPWVMAHTRIFDSVVTQ